MLDARGAFKKDPQRKRARENEPQVAEPLPDTPPDYLEPEVQASWCELVALIPAGVAKSCDRYIVEMAATLITRLRIESVVMPQERFSELRRCLGELGMTPASRSKVSAPKPLGNEFDDV